MPQTTARCGSTADDVHTCVVSGWTLRHRRQQQLFVRCRWPHFAPPPPPTSLCASQTAAPCDSAADDVSICVADGRALWHHRRQTPYTRRRRPPTATMPPPTSMRTLQTTARCGSAANSSHMRVVDDRPPQCPLPISTRLSPLCTSRGAVIHISRTTHPSVHNARLRLHTYVCAPYRRAHENEHRNHTIARRGATAQPMRDVDRQQPTPQIRAPRRVRRTHHATSEDVRSP